MARQKQHDGQPGDLGLRLISAAVMIPIGLFLVWKGGPWLSAGCGLFAGLMAYEWIRMTGSPSMKAFVFLAMLPFLPAILDAPLWAVLTLAASVFLASLTHPVGSKRGAEAFGMLYVAGMPLALFFMREGPWDGVAVALIFMAIVWGSDSAAYFSGRGFGGPPLHPDSPAKTWSGAIGAILFSALCGVLAARITGGDVFVWVMMGALISIIAQLGDLFESSMKRQYGIKDSSGLVPGHGGLLDRVDGLGMVCVATVLGFLFAPGLVAVLGLSG
ncbi:MAG: phosphatidate cytidylyltransferase [Hyphomonadaceae bacterium]|nr:phosphatidate cytidylyltransferase [Hyphomonadaceae bacterium]